MMIVNWFRPQITTPCFTAERLDKSEMGTMLQALSAEFEITHSFILRVEIVVI